MATELGTRRIRVNAIAPGAIETDFAGGPVRDNAQLNEIFRLRPHLEVWVCPTISVLL